MKTLEVRSVCSGDLGVLSRIDDRNNLNKIGPQTGDKSPFGNKELFPELANPNSSGSDPPDKEKTRPEENLGRGKSGKKSNSSVAANCSDRKNILGGGA